MKGWVGDLQMQQPAQMRTDEAEAVVIQYYTVGMSDVTV
jgi:hypothetical protein